MRLLKYIYSALLIFGISHPSRADILRFNDETRSNERELALRRSWLYGDRNYEGFDISLSNTNKDFWFDIGMYGSDEETTIKNSQPSYHKRWLLLPQVQYTPLEACFARCNSKATKLDLELRVGTGLGLEIKRDSYPLEIKAFDKEVLTSPEEVRVPNYDIQTNMFFAGSLVLRVGFLEGKVTLSYDGGLIKILGIGVRF